MCDVARIVNIHYWHSKPMLQQEHFNHYVGETGGNCNIFHIHAHYVEHVFY